MRSDKLAQAHDQLTQAVEEMTSAEDWQAFLAMAARSHNYSPNNIFLILTPKPRRHPRGWLPGLAEPRPPGPQGRDRHSRAGAVHLPDQGERRARRRRSDQGHQVLRGFRVVHVFDVSQTEGEPLPDVKRPSLLEGDAPAELWDRLASQVAAAGFTLERGECAGANGFTNYLTRTVRIREDVESAQAAKTLAHELAHVHLHNGTEYGKGCRGRSEVEAESVAYVVCQAAGMATTAYSFPYVAYWAAGEVDVVRQTASRVLEVARAIVGSGAPSSRRWPAELSEVRPRCEPRSPPLPWAQKYGTTYRNSARGACQLPAWRRTILVASALLIAGRTSQDPSARLMVTGPALGTPGSTEGRLRLRVETMRPPRLAPEVPLWAISSSSRLAQRPWGLRGRAAIDRSKVAMLVRCSRARSLSAWWSSSVRSRVTRRPNAGGASWKGVSLAGLALPGFPS